MHSKPSARTAIRAIPAKVGYVVGVGIILAVFGLWPYGIIVWLAGQLIRWMT